MTAMTLLPQGRPLTRADLDELPDDGHRYELLDGVLVVSPAPARPHQRAVTRLVVALHTHCPPVLELLPAPFDVVLAEDTVLQPDLLIGRNEDFSDKDLPAAPVLAIEVLSPSTRLFDLNLKHARYQEAGCPSYWVVDPLEPSIICWELRDGEYAEVARATGEEAAELERPFPIRIVPANLVRLDRA
jgi:Uma2 family endonuclease